jgi:hypothetical protein
VVVHNNIQTPAPGYQESTADMAYGNWICNTTVMPEPCLLRVSNITAHAINWTYPDNTSYVRYCLAEPLPRQHCKVEAGLTLLAIVTVTNVIKLICMILTSRTKDEPFLSIGDAVILSATT